MWIPHARSGIPTELEQVCSGWSIGHRAQADAKNTKTLMLKMAGSVEKIDSRVVYAAAQKKDHAAIRKIDETCLALGIAIGNIIALLHPERIIIGGGVSLMGSLFWRGLRRETRNFSLPAFASQVDIVRARLKENVVLLGALNLE